MNLNNKIIGVVGIGYVGLPLAIEFGKKLVEFANSATDISDGLLADLNNIILSSKYGAKIYLENIPFTKQTKKLLNLKLKKQ